MFKPSNLNSNSLEFLVRTALSNGEITPGMAAEISRYRSAVRLSAEDRRYLAILEDAITDGCIRLVGSFSNATSDAPRVKA
ncbi:MAG: hypothetical protein AAF152_20165 [Cyanobacteria bacterium P01_A01_bin.114]